MSRHMNINSSCWTNRPFLFNSLLKGVSVMGKFRYLILSRDEGYLSGKRIELLNKLNCTKWIKVATESFVSLEELLNCFSFSRSFIHSLIISWRFMIKTGELIFMPIIFVKKACFCVNSIELSLASTVHLLIWEK